MINILLGIKKNMSSAYDARGRRVGVTVVEILPNFVTQIKTTEGKDGYNAVQLGIGVKKSVKKPQIGHAKKAGIDSKIRWFREIRTDDTEVKIGETIELSKIFSVGDSVKITGVSKGKGFQGGVRRHGFHGGPKTHGQSDRHRAPGSIGSGTTPGRVLKGKKMAGHMGNDTSSVRNLEIVSISKQENTITVKGAVPGFTGGLVQVIKLGRIKGYTPPPEEKEEEEDLENSEELRKPANQNIRESDSPEFGSSDKSGPQSHSESSENKEEVKENAG